VALYGRLAPDGGFPPARDEPTVAVASLPARARVLAAAPLLRGVPMQSLLELAQLATCRDLEAGEVLIAKGAPPARVFVVTAGRVEAWRAEPEVRAEFGVGSIVGGAVCLGDPEGAWSARAMGRAQVLSFSNEELFDHIEEHQYAVRAMMGAFALERERACDVLAARLGGELRLT
jgi:CRP-like cAMP-binding protein